MNAILKSISYAFTTLALTASLVACSSNDDNTPTPPTPPRKTVNPSRVLKAGLPKSFNDAAFYYNKQGMLDSIVSTDKSKITFTYGGQPSRTSVVNPKVHMKVDIDTETSECDLYLNRNYFTAYATVTTTPKKAGSKSLTNTWTFGYNDAGQLTSARLENQTLITLKYVDGDAVESRVQEINNPKNLLVYNMSYTSKSISQPIDNTAGLMFFDLTLGVDLDPIEFAYYAGLLGTATKHLPLHQICTQNNDEATMTWTLNARRMPTSMKWESGDDMDFITFNW